MIAALAVQTVGGLVWAGGAAARIATLEERVGEQRLVKLRLDGGHGVDERLLLAIAHRLRAIKRGDREDPAR